MHPAHQVVFLLFCLTLKGLACLPASSLLRNLLDSFPSSFVLRELHPQQRGILLLVIGCYYSFLPLTPGNPRSGYEQNVMKNMCPFAYCVQCLGAGYVHCFKSLLPLSRALPYTLPSQFLAQADAILKAGAASLCSGLHFPCLEQCDTTGIW